VTPDGITPDGITPDDRDWTWVLERRCPECGFEAGGFERELVGSMILTNTATWQRILRGPAVSQRPRPTKWSPLEYGCHVRDVFRIYDERLRRMLDENDPQYANWDQDATAVEDNYGAQDPVIVAGDLVIAAATLATRFDSVAGAQ
jgi:hypothetical protein